MKRRCKGSDKPGAWTGFDCKLDAGHSGRCMPYQPPTVDEWRTMYAYISELREMNARQADALAKVQS